MSKIRLMIFMSGFMAAFFLCCFAAFGAAEERREAFSKHWWERINPQEADSGKQLDYANRLKNEGNLRAAAREYRALVYTWPKSPEAPIAQFSYAETLNSRGLYEDAFEAYQFLMDIYAGFFAYEDVIAGQIEIARKLAERTRRFLFFKYAVPHEAIPFFERLVRNCPRCEGVSELQYQIGQINEELKKYDLAADAYQRYLNLYPTGALAEDSSFRKAECYYAMTRRSPNDRALREYAQSLYEYFLSRYSVGRMSGQAVVRLEELRMTQALSYYQEASAYEKNAARTRNPKEKAALFSASKIVYERLIRELPESNWAQMAGPRLDYINQKLEMFDEN